MKKYHLLASVLAVILLATTAGCAEPQPAGLSAEQLDVVVENLLLAINTGNHQQFTQDFSPTMLDAFPEAQFNSMRDLILESSGNYISLGEPKLVNQNGYAIYLYQCEYDKENVIVKVVFVIGGEQVDGLFFDSTNLRAASK